MRGSSIELLAAAGLGPDTPDDRALAFCCRNAPVDVLLVRAADVPEYVQDGVVDAGITGADLVREHQADVSELLALGFGHATLAAAVPQESTARSIADLTGARIATVFPHLATSLLKERGVEDFTIVRTTGAAEVAPRLGLADAIVDLVSSGNTLQRNALRSIGDLFASEALLIARRDPAPAAIHMASILRSVVEARATRYLMLNAPATDVERIARLVPGSRSPTVIPLAEPGMVAMHALVPAVEVWSLLPRLSAAGASAILLVPVERMVG